MKRYISKLFLLIAVIAVPVPTFAKTKKATNATNTTAATTKLSILDKITPLDKDAQIFDNFECISLESNNSCFFGGTNKMIAFDSCFFILDKANLEKVIIYHNNGKFIREIGHTGKGPGEYTDLEDFTLDTIHKRVILLTYPSTVIAYDFGGHFLFQKKITEEAPLWNIDYLNGDFICSSNHQSVTRGKEAFLIFKYDKDFNLKDKYINVLPSSVSMPPFVTNPIIAYKKSGIYFDMFTSSIFLNITDKNMIKRLYIDFKNSAVPLSEYTDVAKFYKDQNNFSFFLDAIAIKDNLLFSFMNKGHAFVSILNIPTGEIKVLTYGGWFPNKLLFCDKEGYIYTTMEPSQYLKQKSIRFEKQTIHYPVTQNSNPIIIKCKLKTSLLFRSNQRKRLVEFQ